MKVLPTVPLIALGISIAGGTLAADLSKADQISNGMSKADVLALMGKPQNTQFSGAKSAVQWCKTGLVTDRYVAVWLLDEKVVGLSTYGKVGTGMCSANFNMIEWNRLPDTVTEVNVHVDKPDQSSPKH